MFIVYSIIVQGGISVNLSHNDLGNNIFVFFAGTVSGIGWIVFLFMWLSGKNISFGVLRFISKNALVILPLHYYVLRCFDWFDIIPFKKDSFVYFVVCVVSLALLCFVGIIFFRTKLYYLMGKKKVTVQELFKE